jgi:hypothetical protein
MHLSYVAGHHAYLEPSGQYAGGFHPFAQGLQRHQFQVSDAIVFAVDQGSQPTALDLELGAGVVVVRFPKVTSGIRITGLWHQFTVEERRKATDSLSEKDQLPSDSVKTILGALATMRRIIGLMDSKDRVEAAKQWSIWTRPRLTARLGPTTRHGGHDGYEFKLVPLTLSAGLFLQVGDAIAFDQEWRRCRNDTCLTWFRIGVGVDAKTKRREFCADRCRVAASQSKESH